MSWWYPKKSRADQLSARFDGLQSRFLEGLDAGPDRLAYLSERLALALTRKDFPSAQIGRWLWVASQYRIYADAEPKIASLAAAALVFLEEALGHEAIDDNHRCELNWILETTVGKLAAFVGPGNLKGCLSGEELAEIDDRLSRYDDTELFEVEKTIQAAQSQLEIIERFGGLGDWTSLALKAEVLIKAAARPGVENAPARAALRYLADVHDIVNDDVGVLGLLDDVYVLEWAYAAVENQTLCLPILDAMLHRHPFVATLGLGAHGEQLDRFGRYVVCAALETVSSSRPGVLVLRESGPYPIISAVAVAVETARSQAGMFETEMELWPDGCPVMIGDGTVNFHARWGGRLEGTLRKRFRLHVAEKGVISVGEEVLPYLARAPREWKRLANGTHISAWLKDRNVDGLIGITGSGRRRPSRHEAVLLITSRAKLDRYLTVMRPQGLTPGALLGACWFDSYGEQHPITGNTTDRPLLYACGDVGAACDLIAAPPQHIERWYVVIDGAAMGRTIHAALASADQLGTSRFCVFTELHEREGVSSLVDQGVEDIWYLEDQDVEAPPLVHPGSSNETDPLARFFGRRSAHWTTTYSIRVGSDPFLDAVAECLRKGSGRRGDDPALDALDLTVAAFLRRASANPLPSPDDRKTLQDLAAAVVGQASTLAVYEPHAAEVRTLFARYSAESGVDQRNALLDLASSFGEKEAVAVVCRSASTAEKCRSAASKYASLRSCEWTTVEGLRYSAPYDRVVVPGWLGRSAMRELSNVGFGAKTDMLFLPFERRWYDSAMSAARRWERRLERATVQRLRRIVDDRFADVEPRWLEQTNKRIALQPTNDIEPIDDAPEINKAESRAIDGIRRVLPSGGDRSDLAKAMLVLFSEPGTFALLPPAGHLIVLPENDLQRGGLEQNLLISVSAIKPGMLTALPLETDRDLVDAWADRMLDDGGAARSRAGRWKDGLKRHFAKSTESYAAFTRRLGEAGERRDPLTVRSWSTDTPSIAPRNYRRVLPIIANLTGDDELQANLDDTVAAIDRVYAARTDAMEAIVREIFSGQIDISRPSIEFDVEGMRVVYALTRVDSVAGIQEVPSELIGRRLHLRDLSKSSGAVE